MKRLLPLHLGLAAGCVAGLVVHARQPVPMVVTVRVPYAATSEIIPPPWLPPQPLTPRLRLVDADRTRLRIPEADYNTMWLERVDFRGADLREADFRQSRIRHCDFRDANMEHADLTDATFDEETRWPAGFDPTAHGARLE